TADLDDVGHGLRHRQPANPADSLLQRLALDVLEDDVGRALVLTGVDHRHQVWVVQARRRPRLAAEALELVRIARDVTMHQLDGDPALQRRVVRAVDGRHATGSDPLLQPVAPAYQRADHVHLFSADRWLYAQVSTPTRPARLHGPRSRASGSCWWSSAKRWSSPT